MKAGIVKQRILLPFVLIGITFLMDSCIPPFKPGFDVSGLTIEKRSNGYLVWFTAQRRIHDVEAFVSQSNWLIITIANASIDLNKIKSAKLLGIIQKIEVEKSASAVQISMKLSEKIGKVEVVRDPETNDLFVDLFTIAKN
jgi:hypothetical protein